jgi:hypothetical protein
MGDQSTTTRIGRARTVYRMLAPALALSLSIIVLAPLLSFVMPGAFDWAVTFRPATLLLLAGKSPYQGPMFLSPPWALLPLIPLIFLPEPIARVLLFGISIASFGYAAKRLGASRRATAALLLSPTVIQCLLLGNLDWLAVLGLTLSPEIGLFFALTKPQVSLGVIIFWFVEAVRQKRVLRTFLPVTVAFLISLVLYGLWPQRWIGLLGGAQDANASLWPYSLPMGLAFIAIALRTSKRSWAMPAGPCLSPHVMFQSWTAALMAVVRSPGWTMALVALLWVWVIIRWIMIY